MKIINLNSYYYSSSVHALLKKTFDKRGFHFMSYVPLIRGEESKHVEEENVVTSECFSSLDRLFFHFKHTRIFKDVVQKIDFTDVELNHAHSLFSNGYIAMKLKRKYKIPYVVAVRDTDLNLFFGKMIHLRKLGRSILREADAVVFLSPSYRDALISTYLASDEQEAMLAKSTILGNGIDAFWLEHRNSRQGLNRESLKLLFVGQVHRRKNIETTVSAIRVLVSRGIDSRLTVVGPVKDDSLLKRLLDSGVVDYIPKQSKESLLEIYRNHDIFVMPSLRETFGLVYAEAMSQGLPVIYSKGQGFDGQFPEGQVGYSVDARDPDAVAEAITKCIRNHDSLSKNAVLSVAKFDWESISDAYVSLYQEIILSAGKSR